MIGGLIARLYPACGATGSQGMPIPDPVNIARLAEDRAGSAALAAPADFEVPPDLPTQAYANKAEAVFAALLLVGTTAPRTWLAAAYPTRLQAHFVARSARLNFPDIVIVEVRETTAGSAVTMYSESVYGRPGTMAQRRRLQEWLAALDVELVGTAEGKN